MDRGVCRIAGRFERGLEGLASESLLLGALVVLTGLSAVASDIERKTARKVETRLLKRLAQFSGPGAQFRRCLRRFEVHRCRNVTVRADLETFFARLVPDGGGHYQHDDEGDDDMPAHIRTILTQSALLVPVTAGRLDLGTWQGLYLWEHRTAPHRRRITVTVLG